MFKITQNNLKNINAILIGFALAFISQTKLRIGKIGIGELIIFINLFYFIIKTTIVNVSYHTLVFRKISFFILVSYTILFLLPITIFSYLLNKPGSEIVDLFAILFSFYFIYYLSIKKFNLLLISKSFVFVFFFILITRYIFFNSSSFEDLRFIAGALNPNQISLYVTCAITLILIYFKKSFLNFCILIIYIYFGIRTLSDAFYLYLFVLFFLFSIKIFFKFKVHIILLLLLPFSIAFIDYFKLSSNFIDLIKNIWSNADEGDERFSLYMNGLKAWVDTPFSFFFGHGAGYFSGVEDKMKLMETHNTLIDSLTIGGIFGICFFYFFILKSLYLFYDKKKLNLFIITVSLIIFTMFHNIVRHPIYWFCVLVIYSFAQNLKKDSKCVE
jgi:hypothetical protein